MYTWRSNYFCGNKVSDYGIENKRVDYATLAKSFDCVLNNEIINHIDFELCSGSDCYYETESGKIFYNYEELEEQLEELEEQLEELEEENEEYTRIETEKEELENARDNPNYHDIYQYYIISFNGAEILEKYTDEIVFYNVELDMYLWGVTHYGTSWDYVLTDIRIETEENNND